MYYQGNFLLIFLFFLICQVKENERNSVGKIVGHNTGMLSPFPPMCSSCRKRKPMSDDFLQNVSCEYLHNSYVSEQTSSSLISCLLFVECNIKYIV